MTTEGIGPMKERECRESPLIRGITRASLSRYVFPTDSFLKTASEDKNTYVLLPPLSLRVLFITKFIGCLACGGFANYFIIELMRYRRVV